MISDILLMPEEVQRHPSVLLDLTVDGMPLIDEGSFLARELEKLYDKRRDG